MTTDNVCKSNSGCFKDYVEVYNPKDFKRVNGKLVMKRKYGKFNREVYVGKLSDFMEILNR